MSSNEPIPCEENPFLHMLGVELVHWSDGEVEFRHVPRPDQLNRQGRLHGGMIATLLDAACGYAGLHAPSGAPPLHGVTLSLNINFMAPGGAEPLCIVGRRVGGGRRVFFSSAEIRTETGTLLASAQGAFRRQSQGVASQSPNQVVPDVDAGELPP